MRLNRHVQRGRWLVRDQQVRLAGNGHCDHGPLLHAARKLMGVILHAFFRRRDAHGVQQLHGLGAGLRLIHPQVQLHRLFDLSAHREHRVQRTHGILEDHGNLFAANLPHLVPVDLEEIPTSKLDRATRDLSGRARDQPHDRQGTHALPATRLADDSKRIAGVQLIRDPVHRVDDAFVGLEFHCQIIDA